MKRLHRLDFLGTPMPPVTGWAMAVLSAATLALVASQLWTLDADGQRLARNLRSADLAMAAVPAARDAMIVRVQAPLPPKTASLPWSDVLAVFDTHATPRIGLLRFEPDQAQAGRVKVSAKARDQATLTAFVHALQGDARLRNVSLIDQTADGGAADRSDRSVSFTVLASWRGELPEPGRTAAAR